MNIKSAALFAGALATVIAAVLGRPSTQPTTPVVPPAPVHITTSGSNSPAIINTGNLTVQYGVPTALSTYWDRLAASQSASPEAKAAFVQNLKENYYSIRALVDLLLAQQPKLISVRTPLIAGNLERAKNEALKLAQDSNTSNSAYSQQLNALVEQIRLLQNSTLEQKLKIGVPVLREGIVPLNQHTVIAAEPSAIEAAHTEAPKVVGDKAWNSALETGRIAIVMTGLIPKGLSEIPIVFAAYLEPEAGKQCLKPIQSDTGSALFNPMISDSCEELMVGWAMGTNRGLMRYYPTLNQCKELTWDTESRNFKDTVLDCPFR